MPLRQYLGRLTWLLLLPLPALAQICKDPQQNHQPQLLATGPHGATQPRFASLDPHTVLDRLTGLHWQRCPQGLSGPDCQTGQLATYSQPQAYNLIRRLNRTGWAGQHDWRLPSLAELQSLLKPDCLRPAIDTQAFPNTPTLPFWSADQDHSFYAYLDFKDGYQGADDQNLANPIRLVRTPASATPTP